MMENMLGLVEKFVEHSENFIGEQLALWGFEIRAFPSTSSPPTGH
jgi:hypothetical protein